MGRCWRCHAFERYYRQVTGWSWRLKVCYHYWHRIGRCRREMSVDIDCCYQVTARIPAQVQCDISENTANKTRILAGAGIKSEEMPPLSLPALIINGQHDDTLMSSCA